MKRTMLIAAASLSLAASASARAETIDVTFTGIVSAALGTTSNSGYTDGQTISGNFYLDSETQSVTGATLGSFLAPATDLSQGSSNPTPASLSSTDAIFTQGIHADGSGSGRNTSITVDFSALGSFTGSDPYAFLKQDPATLASLIDFTGSASAFPSTVTYYDGDAAATNFTNLSAYINGISVSVVPLPAAGWLLGSGMIGLLALGRRRQA